MFMFIVLQNKLNLIRSTEHSEWRVYNMYLGGYGICDTFQAISW